MITAKVAKLGGLVKEVALEDNSTVYQALEVAGMDATGMEIKVNGRSHDAEFRLHSGDIITLAPRVKGGR